MNHKNLSIKERYILFFVLLFCTILMGTFLCKSWYQSPDMHLVQAIQLMAENKSDEALNHLILAQKSKDSMTQRITNLYLGRLYHHGQDGIPVDMKKAAFYYEQAAALNSIEAIYTLALLYDAGDKIPENREKAKDYMVKAAQVMPDAQYALAVWIERGYFGEPNTQKAVNLYERAAQAGHINATKSLISIYHGGFGGFPKNIQKEQYWRARLK